VIWAEYVALAQDLARHPDEASRRSAVSRAYYGAFNASRRWLEANVTSIENRAVHHGVWKTFKTTDSATDATRAKWKLVGELGGALRTLRNRADYDDGVPELEHLAPEGVATAERILRLLGELEVARPG
jgi:hypothetical protein